MNWIATWLGEPYNLAMAYCIGLAVLITVCCALACWPTQRRRRDDSVKVGRL